MDHQALVPLLGSVGLTKNEALAYLTLLADEGTGMTGYEVAARGGIPRSAVYGVLRKLETQGAAFATGTDPVRFTALEPARWIEQVRRSTLHSLGELQAALEDLPKRDRPEPIWVLRSYDEVMDRISAMIRSARASLYLSLWPRELARVDAALQTVAARDLHRVLHSPAQLEDVPEPAGFSCWCDLLSRDEAKARWSHRALVIVDRRQALIGGAEPDADNHAVYTTNPSLVDVATNHIILDITQMARARKLDPTDVVAPMMRPHLPKAS